MEQSIRKQTTLSLSLPWRRSRDLYQIQRRSHQILHGSLDLLHGPTIDKFEAQEVMDEVARVRLESGFGMETPPLDPTQLGFKVQEPSSAHIALRLDSL